MDMYSLVLAFHVVVCVAVILVVLVQSGKGAGFSGIFGGGGSDAVFSAPSGTMFIKKVTTGIAVAFFLTSLLMTYLGARRGFRTVTREISMPTSTPAVPAPSASEEKPTPSPSQPASEATPASPK